MARRIASLTVLLAFVVGVPVLLLHMTGLPVVDDLPDLKGLEKAIELRWVPLEWVVAILALAAWILWAYLALAIVLRLAGHAERRLRSAGRMWTASEAFTWSPVKLFVDVAIGAALITSTVGHSSARAASSNGAAGWSALIQPQMAAIRSEASVARRSNGAVGSVQRELNKRDQSEKYKAPARSEHPIYVVRPGDSLWSIAEAKLDDPYLWKEIWKLNRDWEVAEGQRLEKPGFIQPSWKLRLPNGNQRVEAHGDPRADHCDPELPSNESEMGAPNAEPDSSPSPNAQNPPRTLPHDERVELPSGSAVTLGFIAGFLSALGLSGLVRRRRREPGHPSPGWPRVRPRQDLKGRLIRATDSASAPPTHDVADLLTRQVPSPQAEIVLGHREGQPVVASRRGRVYSFSGQTEDVLSYLRDLSLHAALSHRGHIEVWTTQALELSTLSELRTFGDPRSLVSELEIEILKRHRMFDEEGAPTWERHQDEWPDDPLALVLGVATVGDPNLQNRFRAVATQGQDLGIIVVAVEDKDTTFQVEGHLVRDLRAEGDLGKEPFQAIHLTDADRLEMLETLARKSREPEPPEPESRTQTAPKVDSDADAGIRVKLFGRPLIDGVDEQASDGFGPKSRECLFLFLLNPEGMTREEAIETLWPGTETEQGINRFKFQLRKVRDHLRSDRAPTAKFIDKTGDSYRPTSELFSVDVWQFDRLLAKAEEGSAIQSLSEAVALYRGELLQGLYYEWAEPLRSHFQERFLDVLAKLSDLKSSANDYEGALTAVLKAIEVDRYAEHLYRRAMSLYSRLGRASDIQRIYRDLEAALADGLDAEPDAETSSLKDRLVGPMSQSA